MRSTHLCPCGATIPAYVPRCRACKAGYTHDQWVLLIQAHQQQRAFTELPYAVAELLLVAEG